MWTFRDGFDYRQDWFVHPQNPRPASRSSALFPGVMVVLAVSSAAPHAAAQSHQARVCTSYTHLSEKEAQHLDALIDMRVRERGRTVLREKVPNQEQGIDPCGSLRLPVPDELHLSVVCGADSCSVTHVGGPASRIVAGTTFVSKRRLAEQLRLAVDASFETLTPPTVPSHPKSTWNDQAIDRDDSGLGRRMITAGWTIFGTAYLAQILGVTMACDGDCKHDEPLVALIPFVGGYAAASSTPAPGEGGGAYASEDDQTKAKVATAVLGGVQITGLLIALAGHARKSDGADEDSHASWGLTTHVVPGGDYVDAGAWVRF